MNIHAPVHDEVYLHSELILISIAIAIFQHREFNVNSTEKVAYRLARAGNLEMRRNPASSRGTAGVKLGALVFYPLYSDSLISVTWIARYVN